jgi:hypothetical protein
MQELDRQTAEITARAQRLRAARRRRHALLLSAGGTAAALALAAAVTHYLPLFRRLAQAIPGPIVYGAAIASNPVAGLVIIILLAFALGVCTALLFLHRRR